MTEATGHQILTGLIETRKFFDQISLLIRTAEDLLLDEGWETLFGNKCADLSAHLYRPKKWMPREIYRFFVVGEDGEENRNMVIFTGVLLDIEDAWGGFQEPWVTCGLYQFNTEKFDVTKFSYWDWVRAHLDDKHDADGVFHEYECSPEEQEEWEGLIYQATMALPLTAIDGAQTLKQKLIEPLLKKVAEVTEGGARKE